MGHVMALAPDDIHCRAGQKDPDLHPRGDGAIGQGEGNGRQFGIDPPGHHDHQFFGILFHDSFSGLA